MLKLNLGCGTNKLDGWENYDVDVDLRQPLPWSDGSADFILLEHVLEHFNSAAGYAILEECHRVLKTGGVARICVPDVTRVAHGDPSYGEFLESQGWGSNAVKVIATCHGHEMLWTFESLSAVLSSIGFTVQSAQPRVSMHPELVNVEGHHKVVGTKFNDIETLVVEATKREKSDASWHGRLARVERAPNTAGTAVPRRSVIVTDSTVTANAIQRQPLGIDVRVAATFDDIPRVAAGAEIVLCIFDVAWVQDFRGIDLLLEAATDGSLAVVAQLHPSFEHLHQPVNAVRTALRHVYVAGYGEELARQITWKPVLDAGVFALRTDSDFWDIWRRAHQVAAVRTNDPLLRLASFNVALATSGFKCHPLPQWVHWPCDLALPMFDDDRGLLVEPTLPHEVISIVRPGSLEGKLVPLRTKKGGIVSMNLDVRY